MATRLRSTSRAPWKALKKTPKKTRTTARIDLGLDAEAEGDGEDRAEDDARDRVGGLDEGREAARRAAGPGRAAMPQTTPRIEPMTKPSTASSSVTRIWSPSEPWLGADGEPVDEVGPDARGLAPEERVDDLGVDAALPQRRAATTTMPSRPARPARRRVARRAAARRRRAGGAAARRDGGLCGQGVGTRRRVVGVSIMTPPPSPGRAGVRLGDLGAQRLPDLLVDLGEARVEADLLDDRAAGAGRSRTPP